jgi:hypothetical protein
MALDIGTCRLAELSNMIEVQFRLNNVFFRFTLVISERISEARPERG